jgi:predicted aconitase with swiveling domain
MQRRARSYPPPCGKGRPPERSEGGRGGGGAVVLASHHNNDPHPQPLPSQSRVYPISARLKCRTRASPGSVGRGADRVCGNDVPETKTNTLELDDMNGAIFFAAAGMGAKARGQALVAKDGFSARYDLDRVRGIFSRPDHKLAGESYVGRVLVLDAAKGGVATAWMLNEMKARGIMPAALVLNAVNPIMVQGAALADFTMISGFDVDITQAIPNGAMVEVDPTGERPFIRVARLRA